MAQTDLRPGATSDFSADEQSFFRQGEANESGEFQLDDQNERPRLSRSWRPRLILIGAAVGVAVLVLSLVGGQRQVDAIAAVRAAPPLNLPATLPTEAPAPEAAAIAVPTADGVHAAKSKSKHAHHNRVSARGKRR
jgi:hypothetical protein